MTQSAALGLNKGCSVGALTPPARQVHLAVMSAFAGTGRAPARGELERTARAHGADLRRGAGRPRRARRDRLRRPTARSGRPAASRRCPPRSRWSARGPLTYAMCAIDALGMSAMLGRPVTITAAEPGTGRLITVHAHRGRGQRAQRRNAVLRSGQSLVARRSQQFPDVQRVAARQLPAGRAERRARRWPEFRVDESGDAGHAQCRQSHAVHRGVVRRRRDRVPPAGIALAHGQDDQHRGLRGARSEIGQPRQRRTVEPIADRPPSAAAAGDRPGSRTASTGRAPPRTQRRANHRPPGPARPLRPGPGRPGAGAARQRRPTAPTAPAAGALPRTPCPPQARGRGHAATGTPDPRRTGAPPPAAPSFRSRPLR